MTAQLMNFASSNASHVIAADDAPVAAGRPGMTLTGVDYRTDVSALQDLVATNPGLEFGLLYSATPEARRRYPELSWLVATANALAGRCAIHVCGRLARALLIAGELEELVAPAARVQVNGDVTPEELPLLARRVQTLITQFNPRVHDLSQEGGVSNHQLLVDASGGRGISPSAWHRPNTGKVVGFAGGLGPHNLEAEASRLAMVARTGWWLDMEESLRTDDWFDVGRCRGVLAAWSALPYSSTAP
ncbi:hypothetical protein [Rhodanobacter denitrificans]|uniref:Phosphoribosylanthranilate isomerase n=1 Tax=Rhodanobacter denitrificans TaxID=666685 RepID=M4NEA7_9GAMM|nr:hypothetical protein [Rhodanobacter denitrificans]AGG89074.1 hypothetical protein R2APBS1_1951 [Rhodanobacter denitrificans]UJJ53101.1 hypothetical protein LRK52_18520 [Rhodanobacter denitrificans]